MTMEHTHIFCGSSDRGGRFVKLHGKANTPWLLGGCLRLVTIRGKFSRLFLWATEVLHLARGYDSSFPVDNLASRQGQG